MNTTTETLIIGQGLAGTTLAHTLQERKADFLVLDNHLYRSSSLVAAGLYNPIVFFKQNLSFNAENLIPFTKEYFKKWEELVGQEVHTERVFFRIFSSIEEQNDWLARSGNKPYSLFMSGRVENPDLTKVAAPFGGSKVSEAGNVDVKSYIKESRSYFESNNQLISDRVISCDVSTDGSWKVRTENGKTITAKKIVFCEGHQIIENKFFNYLPVTQTKGDVLTIKCVGLDEVDVLNAGFFIMPLGIDLYRVGATFEWDNQSHEPSPKARIELEEKLQGLLKIPYEVLDQQTGMRPTVGDRRPVLGEHPDKRGLYLFNGLGSKGVMLAPYCADQLVRHIFDHQPLDKEVSIERYKKHYGHSKN